MRGSSASAAHKAPFTACLVTDIGGLNDKSFNHLAYVGLKLAEVEAGSRGVSSPRSRPADYIPNLQRASVRRGVTVGVGFLMTDCDGRCGDVVPGQQVRDHRRRRRPAEAQAEERPGPALQGAGGGLPRRLRGGLWYATSRTASRSSAPSAASRSRRSTATSPATSSARRRRPGLKALNDYSQDFVAQAKCKEKALNQIANSAVVIFQVAGACGLGALDAAQEKKVLGIGVDADQATSVATS
jgi:basic membrane protein A